MHNSLSTKSRIINSLSFMKLLFIKRWVQHMLNICHILLSYIYTYIFISSSINFSNLYIVEIANAYAQHILTYLLLFSIFKSISSCKLISSYKLISSCKLNKMIKLLQKKKKQINNINNFLNIMLAFWLVHIRYLWTQHRCCIY